VIDRVPPNISPQLVTTILCAGATLAMLYACMYTTLRLIRDLFLKDDHDDLPPAG